MSNFVRIPPGLLRVFLFTSNVFIETDEYSNKISFITDQKVRVPCLSITLRSSLILWDNYQMIYE